MTTQRIVIADQDSAQQAFYDRDAESLVVIYRNGKSDTFTNVKPAQFSEFSKALELGMSIIRELRRTRSVAESLAAVGMEETRG